MKACGAFPLVGFGELLAPFLSSAGDLVKENLTGNVVAGFALPELGAGPRVAPEGLGGNDDSGNSRPGGRACSDDGLEKPFIHKDDIAFL